MISITVLFESEELLVVDKPSGLVVHRGFSGDDDDVLRRLAAQGYPRLFPVHRLDRGTSGVLALARSSEVARCVAARFSQNSLEKIYWVFVRGSFSRISIDVDHPVPRDEDGERVAAQTTMRSVQEVEVSDSPLRETRYSWVEARPHTGRFHQVRRHAKHLGHPTLGDTTYGRSEHNRFIRDRCGLSRLALHARRLAIPGFIDVESPLPSDISEPMARLGFEVPSRCGVIGAGWQRRS